MSTIIEGLFVFDEQRNCILEHVYRARPPKPQELILRYSNQPILQPAVLQLPDLNPPTTVYSVSHANILLLCTSCTDSQSLGILEFLHRVADIFEDFLGSPLLSNKIEENYEIIAQILAEVCDGGIICNTETNSLRESIEVSSRLGRLFETVGIPGSTPGPGPTNLAATLKANSAAASGPAIPWRRPNVRHTSNELYVDIVESLSVIFAPSGRLLSARVNGSIAFTSKISGVPDLSLVLTAPGGTSLAKTSGISRTISLPVFHPCVRLAIWREHPGELSFIPPDGKFMLAGYEVDLLPSSLNPDQPLSSTERLFLPAMVDLKSGLGSSGMDFEVRLTLNNAFPGVPTSRPTATNTRTTSTTAPFSLGTGPNSGSSGAPTLDGVVVSIPFSDDIKNITDFKASRGDATFDFTQEVVEWKVPTKDGFSVNGTATLTGTVVCAFDGGNVGHEEDDDDDDGEDQDAAEVGKSKTLAGYYDEAALNNHGSGSLKQINGANTLRPSKQNRDESSKKVMPRSIAVSFSVKGWLPSGIKVDSLMIDTKKSRGLGEGVKPYKGVKYLTVSRKGVERRL